MDLYGSKDSNQMTATFEVPGLTKSDIDIDIQNNRLIVSGQHTTEESRDDNEFAIRERRTGRFSRTLPLPGGTKVCYLPSFFIRIDVDVFSYEVGPNQCQAW